MDPYLSSMKKMIIIFCFLHSALLFAQTIEFSQFSEATMNEVMFNRMNEYSLLHGGDSLTQSTTAQEEIYRILKKKSDRLTLDEIAQIINKKILKKYDTDSFMCVGLIDSIGCDDISTYQELADKCITNWESNPGQAFFLVGWGRVAGITSYFNSKNSTIYVALSYLP
jgi:hypothetical protein